MCGFVGLVNLDFEKPARPDIPLLERLCRLQAHRGPDGFGVASSGPFAVAHRRLSILDPTPNGAQPMSSEDGAVIFAFTGEIYNHLELREKHRLDEKFRFRSKTDTEVAFHLYQHAGESSLELLNGMFSMAIWDRGPGRLLLARDAFGTKPMFYLLSDGALWFSTEIKSLLGARGHAPAPSKEAFWHYLSLNYIPGELTAFEGIRELRPGTVLSLDRHAREPRTRAFFSWRPAVDPSPPPSIELIGSVLEQAVIRHLKADFPVGLMLSGGMDSSTIGVIASRHLRQKELHSYTLKFDEPSFDESKSAQVMASFLKTRHHVIHVTPGAVMSRIRSAIAHVDEPLADGALVPTFMLSELASRDVKVLLSGEGGDEAFAGYDTYAAHNARNWYRQIPRWFRRGGIAPWVERLPTSHRKLSFDFKAKRFARGAELGVPESHFYWRVVLEEREKASLVARSANFEGLPPTESLFVEAYLQSSAPDPLNRLIEVDYRYHLADDLMVECDRMTMAHSIEARVPFTDLELARLMARLPPEAKIRGLSKKRLLKRVMRDRLPPEILRKPKKGLELPYSSWFLQDLRPAIESMIRGEALRDLGFLDPGALQRIWHEHASGRRDHGRALWGILVYLIWFDLYFRAKDYGANLVTAPHADVDRTPPSPQDLLV